MTRAAFSSDAAGPPNSSTDSRGRPFLIASLAKLARRGSRPGARLLRRRSLTESVSARSPSSLGADRALERSTYVECSLAGVLIRGSGSRRVLDLSRDHDRIA
jgi:hypothetical protein